MKLGLKFLWHVNFQSLIRYTQSRGVSRFFWRGGGGGADVLGGFVGILRDFQGFFPGVRDFLE